LFLILELRGVEPLSENPSIKTSPITVGFLTFPLPAANQRAAGFGSLYFFLHPEARVKKCLV